MKCKREEYYNYIYLDPRKPGKYEYENLDFCLLYEPFYVGKGKDKRYLSHIKEAKKKGKTQGNIKVNKILKIQDIGFKQEDYIILFNFTNDEQKAFNNEKYIIDMIGLDNLANWMEGGGFVTPIKKFKNKTYEEIYGDEKALELKLKKSGLNNYLCKKVFCYDRYHNLLWESDKGLNSFCNENNLPIGTIRMSIKKNGHPMFYCKSAMKRAKRNNMENLIGAYCLTEGQVQNEEFKDIDNFLNKKIKDIENRSKSKGDRKVGKIIEIYDNTDKLIYKLDGTFTKFCRENKLPISALRESCKNNSERLYQNLSNANISQLKNNGYYQYKGWYAKYKER